MNPISSTPSPKLSFFIYRQFTVQSGWNVMARRRYPKAGVALKPWLGDMTAEEQDPQEVDASVSMKLVLTLSPFLFIIIFLLIEWWIRGRS